jgi:hypothetical protein
VSYVAREFRVSWLERRVLEEELYICPEGTRAPQDREDGLQEMPQRRTQTDVVRKGGRLRLQSWKLIEIHMRQIRASSSRLVKVSFLFPPLRPVLLRFRLSLGLPRLPSTFRLVMEGHLPVPALRPFDVVCPTIFSDTQNCLPPVLFSLYVLSCQLRHFIPVSVTSFSYVTSFHYQSHFCYLRHFIPVSVSLLSATSLHSSINLTSVRYVTSFQYQSHFC